MAKKIAKKEVSEATNNIIEEKQYKYKDSDKVTLIATGKSKHMKKGSIHVNIGWPMAKLLIAKGYAELKN